MDQYLCGNCELLRLDGMLLIFKRILFDLCGLLGEPLNWRNW